MSSIVSKIADEIRLHGSYEAYCLFRDKEEIEGFPGPNEFGGKIKIRLDSVTDNYTADLRCQSKEIFLYPDNFHH